VFGRRTATTAHDRNPEFFNKALVEIRQLFGRQMIMRHTADILREPGIRQDRNVLHGIFTKGPDMFRHFGGTGRAIHPDHIHREHL